MPEEKPYSHIEPHGDLRKMADMLFQAFVSFRQAGFSESQAMSMVEKMTERMNRSK